jgi:hypothetical protein
MAEISRDTQAILDRLKREGSLTRNGGDGKNSLKTVKINLEKFGVLFQGIQNELANLNKTFGQMLNANPNTFTGPLPQGAQAVAQTTLEPIPVQFDAEQLRALGLDEETIELQKEAAKLNIANNLEDEKLRNLLLNTMIDVSDKQFGTSIRKKFLSQQSKSSDKIKR